MDADARPATTLASAWPLFALRIRSERLVLRLPTDDEILALIDVARDRIHPPDEMPFGVAWSMLPSPDFERGFVQHHWLMRATWTPDDWNLNLMAELDGQPVGSQTVHGQSFQLHRAVDTGSWLARDWQRQGLGKEMRSAVLAFVFDGLGAQVATSEAFLDNVASNRVSRSVGYADNGHGALAPQGASRETQRFRMTVEAWRSRPRPPIAIEGLDTCREMFGA